MLNLSILQELTESMKKGKRLALVTVLNLTGSSPGQPGSQMIVFPDRSIKGTIGGGSLENQSINMAIECIEKGENKEVELSLSAADIGMTCGGSVRVLIQTYRSNPKLLVVGGGHVSLALYDVMKLLDFDIYILDDRKEFANRERFPEAVDVICEDMGPALEKFDFDSNTYVVIATRGHTHDELALKAVVNRDLKYVGVIGSKNKVLGMNKNLLDEGIPKENLDKIYTPIGLNVANKTPREISISIAAEILAVKNNKVQSVEHMKL